MSEQQKLNQAAGASQSRLPGPVQPQGAARSAPPAGLHGATASSSTVPILVDSLRTDPGGRPDMRRPQMVEDEPTRRRRKMKEFLGELSPGLEMEWGIAEVGVFTVDN